SGRSVHGRPPSSSSLVRCRCKNYGPNPLRACVMGCGLPVKGPATASPGIVTGVPKKQEILEIEGREVTITNPDKVFFPELRKTKMDLVRYYLAVAPGAIRGVAGRPMAMKRFVNGAGGEFFFQKRAP